MLKSCFREAEHRRPGSNEIDFVTPVSGVEGLIRELRALKRRGFALAMAAVLGLVGACEGGTADHPISSNRSDPSAAMFGAGGQDFLGGDEAGAGAGPGSAGAGVSPYLWRASLDTISFMPIASVDPLAGVIITDWYEPPETLHERVKINLYIVRHDLSADGIHAAGFHQRQDSLGDWVDAESDEQMARDLVDAIVGQARRLWFHQRRDPVDPYGPVARAKRSAPVPSEPVTF